MSILSRARDSIRRMTRSDSSSSTEERGAPIILSPFPGQSSGQDVDRSKAAREIGIEAAGADCQANEGEIERVKELAAAFADRVIADEFDREAEHDRLLLERVGRAEEDVHARRAERDEAERKLDCASQDEAELVGLDSGRWHSVVRWGSAVGMAALTGLALGFTCDAAEMTLTTHTVIDRIAPFAVGILYGVAGGLSLVDWSREQVKRAYVFVGGMAFAGPMIGLAIYRTIEMAVDPGAAFRSGILTLIEVAGAVGLTLAGDAMRGVRARRDEQSPITKTTKLRKLELATAVARLAEADAILLDLQKQVGQRERAHFAGESLTRALVAEAVFAYHNTIRANVAASAGAEFEEPGEAAEGAGMEN